MTEYKDIKQASINPISNGVLVSSDNKYYVQYRIISDDYNKTSAWSNINQFSASAVSTVNIALADLGNGVGQITWGDENNRPQYDIFTYQVQKLDFSQTEWSPSTNALKIAKRSRPNSTHALVVTPAKPHRLKQGMRITIAGIGNNYDTASAFVTNVPNVFAFNYNNVPTTTTGSLANLTAGTITLHSTDTQTRVTVNVADCIYHGTSNVHTYSVVSSSYSDIEMQWNTGGTALELVPYSTVTYSYPSSNAVWAVVQVASYDKVLSNTLQIAPNLADANLTNSFKAIVS